MMSNIILIHGLKRSGKNYLADEIQNRLELSGKKVIAIAFADPIKEILASTLNMSVQELDDAKNNGKHIIVEQKIGIKKQCTVRELLQRFGTDTMQNQFGKHVWANIVYTQAYDHFAEGGDYVIITDWRFAHEYQPHFDIFTVKIFNDDIQNNDNHVSEQMKFDAVFDIEIDNTGQRDISADVNKLIKLLGE